MPTLNNYLELNGVKDVEDFLEPSGRSLESCFVYINMKEAVQTLKYIYLKENSLIYILCDSGDTDGWTSSVILYQYLIKLKEDWDIKILLHKGKERGLQDDELFNKCLTEPCDLLIIPDSGTNDRDRAKEIYDKTDTLILCLDHHQLNTPIEVGCLVSNQVGEANPNGSGALVTHKFLQALDKEFDKNWSGQFIDLVALSLISDSMDMSDMQNRTYYYYGLETIDCVQNEFLKAMIEKFIGDKPYTQKDISFKIVPKCNAVSRSSNQELKQQLVMAFLGYDIEDTLDKCEQAHKDQIETVNRIVQEAKEKVDFNNNLIVFADECVPKSYSGLIAAKISDKPTMVGSIKDGEFIGSVRSPIPLREELDNNELVEWANGHEFAFGICVKESNIQLLTNYYNTLNLSYEPCTSVIKSYPIKSIPKRLFGLFEPYNALWGHCIPIPLIHVTLDYSPTEIRVMGKGQTTLKISQGGVDIVFFFMGAEKKEQLGLICEETTQVDPNSGEAIDLKQWCALDSNKRSLEVIGTFGINEYTSKYGKVYRTNQIIVDEFEVKKYKQKTLSDLL